MRLSDTVWGMLFMALSFALMGSGVYYAGGVVIGGGTFPMVLGCALFACAATLIARDWGRMRPHFVLNPWVRSPRYASNFLAVLVCLAFFAASAQFLGFHVALLVSVGCMLFKLGSKPGISLLFAALTAVVMHLIFYKGLRVPLPWGLVPAFY